ncbi:unnamed protein product [Adineta steineri]|uniref:Uncharacterized protein n=1 Tax=Adineta steineri TaxID=433720 RepID=A0A814QIS7_9BILA|nr:unnamed protein product [Adineta steineri]CAF3899900.1 unnamed protein product [Adineta steineri]
MEKINQLICFIGLMVAMVTCIAGISVNQRKMNDFAKDLSKNVEGTDCVTTSVGSQSCHAGHCHNSQTYIHGCDTYDQQWDNLTVNYDTHNSTGWRNTTCNLYAAWEPAIDDTCGYANLTYSSCTNGDCRNGVIDINACYSPNYVVNYLRNAASTLFAGGVDDSVNDFFDIPCVNLLFDTFSRRHFDNNKIERL